MPKIGKIHLYSEFKVEAFQLAFVSCAITRRGMKTALLAIIAALFLSAPALGQDASQSDKAHAAEALGKVLWEYDQAAWHATDQLQVDLAGKAPPQGAAGFLVEPVEAGGLDAIFYGSRSGAYYVIARYHWQGGTKVSGGLAKVETETLDPVGLRMIAARNAAVRAAEKGLDGVFLCSHSPPNTIVLPPDADGSVSVYLLSSTLDAGEYPLGGHSRIDIDTNGQVKAARGFMKGCFPVRWDKKDGARPELMFVTHVLDQQPNEIDFFVSRNVPIGLVIAAGGYAWPIADGVLGQTEPLPK